MGFNAKEFKKSLLVENEIKKKRQIATIPSFSSGSYSEEGDDGSVTVSSLTEFIKGKKLVDADRSLLLDGDFYKPTNLPIEARLSTSLDGSNGFAIVDGDRKIEIIPFVDNTLSASLSSNRVGRVQYDISDSSKLIVDAKENGLRLAWQIDQYSSLKRFGRKYYFECTNCSLTYDSKRGNILFVDSNGKEIYRLSRPYLVDGDGNTYRNCGYTDVGLGEKGTFFVYINTRWLSSVAPKLPLTLETPIIKKQAYAIDAYGIRDGYVADPIDSAIYVGRKGGKSFSTVFTVDSSSIVKVLSQKQIRTFGVSLNVFYKKRARLSDSPGFLVTSKNGILKLDSFNLDEGVIKLDITELIAYEYRLWAKGGYEPKPIDVRISYKSEVSGGSFSNPVLPDDDYIEVFGIDYYDSAKRPNISLSTQDDGAVGKGTPFKTFKVGEAGISSINVLTGRLTHDISLGTFSDGSISLPITLHYDDRFDDNESFGGGWSLSLERRLLKDGSSEKTLGVKRTRYVDGNGDSHYLDEEWFYEEGKSKVLIDKKDVYLGNDQKLKFDLKDSAGNLIGTKDVQYQTRNGEGLYLISASANGGYASKSDLKLNLKKSSIKYKIGFEEFEATDLSNGQIIAKGYYKVRTNLSSEDLSWAKDFAESLDNETIAEFIDPKEVRFKEDGTPYAEDGSTLKTMDIEITFSAADGGVILFYPKFRLYLDKNIDGTFGTEYIEHGNYELPAILNKSYYISTDAVYDYKSNDDIETVKAQLESVEESIRQMGDTLRSLRTNLSSSISMVGHAKMSSILSEKAYALQKDSDSASSEYEKIYGLQIGESNAYSLFSAETQKEAIAVQIRIYSNQLLSLLNKRDNLAERLDALIELSKEGATDYLVDENGNYLVFDHDGRMIGVSDSNDNAIMIGYDEGKIVSISGKSGLSATIVYDDDGFPSFMQLQDGRRIDFNYKNGALNSIKWGAEDKREAVAGFSYGLNKKLSSVVSAGLKEIGFMRQNGRIASIQSTVFPKEISYGKAITQEAIKYEHMLFERNGGSITASDTNNGITEEYFISPSGDVASSIKTNGNKIDYSMSNFSDDGKRYSFGCAHRWVDGIGTDEIMELTNPNLISDRMSREIVVEDDGEEDGVIYRSKLKQGHLVSFIQKIIPSAVYANGLFRCYFSIQQYRDKTLLKSSSFDFDEVRDGFLCAPFRLLPKTTRIVLDIVCENSGIDFSVLENTRLYNITGEVCTYDAKGNLATVESNDGMTENSGFFKKKPTKSVFTDNYGRAKTSRFKFDGEAKLILSEDGDGNCESYSYDDEGRVIEKKTFNSKDSAACSLIGYSYDEKGVVAELAGEIRDEDGEFPSAKAEYDKYSGLLVKETKPNGQRIIHGYDQFTLMETSISSDDDGLANVIDKEYKYGLLTRLSHEGASFFYGYDGFGRKTWVALESADNKLVSYSYLDYANYPYFAETHERSKQLTSVGGFSCIYTYDRYGMLSSKKYGEYEFKYIYDQNGNLTSKIDSSLNLSYVYAYNEKGKMIGSSHVDKYFSVSKAYAYDDYERVSEITIDVNDARCFDFLYTYDDKDRIVSLSSFAGEDVAKIIYIYTTSDQVKKKLLAFDRVSMEFEYDYLRQDEHLTGLVSRYSLRINGENYTRQRMTYGVAGDILEIKQPEGDIRYEYDKLGRLAKEANAQLGKAFEYSYDRSGNVIERKECDDLNDEKPTIIKSYSYGNDLWRDQLTSIKTVRDSGSSKETFTYGRIGEPKKYNGKRFSWEANLLLAGIDADISYAYNSEGVRMAKKAPNVIERYILDGSRILRIVRNESDIDFVYSSDKVEGFKYKGTNYLYIKNVFDDVVGIMDASTNKIVAKYAYDAWGRQIVFDGDGKVVIDFDGIISVAYADSILDFIGYVNPIRYRGYFFDNESGFYYLNRRYYDPSTGRFISPDSLSILDETMSQINGLNLYIYCCNNPIRDVDGDGKIGFVTGLLISIAIGAIVSAVSYTGSKAIEYFETGEFKWSMAEFGASIIGGAIGGALSFVTLGAGTALSSFVSGSLSTMTTMLLENAWADTKHSFEEICASSLFSGIFSALTANSPIKINGLNSGRGSFAAVTNQINRKLFNNTINQISAKTFAKMLVYNLFDSFDDFVFDEFYDDVSVFIKKAIGHK